SGRGPGLHRRRLYRRRRPRPIGPTSEIGAVLPIMERHGPGLRGGPGRAVNAADHRWAGPAPATAPAPNRTTRSGWNWTLPVARFTPKFQSMTVIAQPEMAEPGLARVSQQHLDWRVHQC